MTGFYNINKPSGANSTYMVSLVKRETKQKCGHLGTLDPMAAGVLPVAVGKATKLFDWFLNKDKKYFAIGQFGVLTDTLDAEGKILSKESVNIKKEQIDNIIHKFQGEIYQTPPQYSSICVNGKRAYELARDGQNIDLPSRRVNIYSVKCTKQISNDLFAFEIHCSAGTYVRSLVLDIAKELNTVATTVCIIRTASGAFTIENSYTPEQISSGEAKLVEIDEVIGLPKLYFDNDKTLKLLNGQTLIFNSPNGEYLCYNTNKIIGIAKVYNNRLKININLWENTND